VSDSNDHPPGRPLLVSACLLGLATRYDGSHRLCPDLLSMAHACTLIPVCPEQLGGLPTPRPPAEVASGTGADVLDGAARVVDSTGADVTDRYLRGAELAARIAELTGARSAVLKEGSPSCGVSRIRRDGADAPGEGVAAALLRRRGLQLEGRQ
jgi:uncharacterized protein YbbK (DUF523 family)